ncbi:MAG: DNA recombination protein RmuC [Cycloclasticus sp.]|jgi:DNA recombination protein RmuC|nr:DNA recombination protein RmuC [Cycloclasticus sp.]HIL91599.1 DNA recombination protein RmuC [Cycloclasticus sp.]
MNDIIIFAGGLAVGFISAYLMMARANAALKQERMALETRLSVEKELTEQAKHNEKGLMQSFRDSFSALSSQALRENNEEFLKLARENFSKQQNTAESRLSEKEKAFSDMVSPIKDILKQTDAQLKKLEADRQQAFGSISQFLQNMTETQNQLQSETRNLVQALRRPEVRGQWGELTLKRLAELAGLVEHCDFFEQEHLATDEGAMRPDMIIRMPDQRDIVVDAKTPLDAYLTATEQTDDALRKTHLIRHARQVRDRVKELSKKAYWSQFKNTPDFVVLFIPGDQFLSAALEQDHALLEDALEQHVILATPTSLVALLRAIAFGWRQQATTENAEQIRKLGEDMYSRLATFVEHLGKVGNSLDKSVDHYNKAVGSLERQVFPNARKFKDLGIETRKSMPDVEPIEKSTRKQTLIDKTKDE